ncbi:MAG: hybrid sensor histidine kinase/response regulator [bacterium]
MIDSTKTIPVADILVVDDTAANLQLLTVMLKERGHKVRPVPSGKLALQAAHRKTPDLILLDINMPEMDGYEVCMALKADPVLADVPVIFISANNEAMDKVMAFSIGGVDYITKPFQFDEVEARVETHLKIQRLQANLRQSNERLRVLEQLKTDLTNMLVHDMRTPLTSILSGLSTMESMGELNDLQKELLTMGIRGGQTLLGMVNDLLDISKMEDGSLQLERESLSPEELVRAALLQVQALAESKRLVLNTEIDPELPKLSADREKVQRTLMNLLGNALKFTPDGGTVTVAAKRDEKENAVLFAIRDTGEGIPQEAFEQIFDKFGQVESRHAGHTHSTGLGLTLCKMVVELHGGRIWVESQLGEGSVFQFTLPLEVLVAPRENPIAPD